MKKYFASVLFALICCVGFTESALAANRREVTVTVPYEFVAGGQRLSAGTYVVTRVSDERRELSISSYDDRSSVFVLPIEFDDQLAGDSKLIFEQVGDQRVLSEIETLDGTYMLPVSRSGNTVVLAKQHQGMSVSGTN